MPQQNRYFRNASDFIQIQTSMLQAALICIFLTLTSPSSSLSMYRVVVAPGHTQWHALVRNPLSMGSAIRRVRYLNRTHNRIISIPPGGIRTRNSRYQLHGYSRFRRPGLRTCAVFLYLIILIEINTKIYFHSLWIYIKISHSQIWCRIL